MSSTPASFPSRLLHPLLSSRRPALVLLAGGRNIIIAAPAPQPRLSLLIIVRFYSDILEPHELVGVALPLLLLVVQLGEPGHDGRGEGQQRLEPRGRRDLEPAQRRPARRAVHLGEPIPQRAVEARPREIRIVAVQRDGEPLDQVLGGRAAAAARLEREQRRLVKVEHPDAGRGLPVRSGVEVRPVPVSREPRRAQHELDVHAVEARAPVARRHADGDLLGQRARVQPDVAHLVEVQRGVAQTVVEVPSSPFPLPPGPAHAAAAGRLGAQVDAHQTVPALVVGMHGGAQRGRDEQVDEGGPGVGRDGADALGLPGGGDLGAGKVLAVLGPGVEELVVDGLEAQAPPPQPAQVVVVEHLAGPGHQGPGDGEGGGLVFWDVGSSAGATERRRERRPRRPGRIEGPQGVVKVPLEGDSVRTHLDGDFGREARVFVDGAAGPSADDTKVRGLRTALCRFRGRMRRWQRRVLIFDLWRRGSSSWRSRVELNTQALASRGHGRPLSGAPQMIQISGQYCLVIDIYNVFSG